MSKLSSDKIVKVTWLDTNENSVGGWIEKEDLDKSKVCSVDSLGWLYLENDEFIVILADKDTHDEDDLFDRSQVIPRGVIKNIEYLIS